jgi:hypothetical protein
MRTRAARGKDSQTISHASHGNRSPVEVERAGSSQVLPRLRRWTSGRRGGLTALLVYLLGAVVLTYGAWSDPTSGWAGGCCDQEQTIWFLGWIFGFNILLVGGIALSGFTAWLAIRRWTGDGAGPIVGGAVYAFSPYVASHAAMHLNLATAWIPPLFLLIIDELLVTRRRPPWQAGVALGVLSTAQLLISEETLAMSVVAAGLLVCVMALARRDRQRRARWREGAARLLPALAVATLTFLLLAAGPLVAQFFGPQRISQQVQHPETFSTDLLNLVLPTPYQLVAPAPATRVSHEFSGLYHEATGYLGLPLLVLLIVAAVRQWDDLRVRVASITGALLLMLSLGPWLHIGKEASRVPLPWLPFGKLPLLEHLLPDRFTLFVWLAVAVIVAIVIGQAARLAPRLAAQWLVAVLAALVLVLPAPLERQPFYTPAFFRTWASHNIGSDETVLVAPYFVNGGQVAPMLWAAEADYGLRMAEAYAYMPRPDGRTRSATPVTRLAKIMLAIQDDHSALLARGEVRAQVTANLRDAEVRHVIVGPMQSLAPMLAFFTDLFGRAPELVDGVAIWRDVNARGVVGAPA